MERSYTARDLIQLPRLSARQAVVLLTEIMTAAAQAKAALHLKKLPAPIERAYGRLVTAHDELSALLAPQPKEGDTQAKRKADRVVDNAWAALFAWLNGWCALPESWNLYLADALALRDLIFATKLEFTQLPYKIEWHESKVRLEAIERDDHDVTIAKLGGKPFLDHLKEAHAAYGAALGVTEVQPETTLNDIRTKQLAAFDALRVFVTRTAAHADPEEPGSEALAERLLAPLVKWESTPSGGADDPSPEGAPSPEGPPTPEAPPKG